MKKDLFQFQQLIENVYNELLIFSNNNKTNKVPVQLLRNAYRIIMTTRFFFTGEEIVYRIYYAINNSANSLNKKVKVYNLTEEEILNLTSREGTSLRLKASFTKALNNKNHNLEREAIFEKHWNDIWIGLEKANWSKQIVYHVHKDIFQRYYSRNHSLYNIKNKRYTTFNRGNLYEAFDATAEDVYKSGYTETVPKYQSQLFHGKYFGTYLTHDQIKGFQTGDVGLTQIKARHAALMEMRTLTIYLREILDILKNTNNLFQDQLKEKIKELFTDPTMIDLDFQVEQTINSKTEELLNMLKIN